MNELKKRFSTSKRGASGAGRAALVGAVLLLQCALHERARGQSAPGGNTALEMQRLADAVTRTETELAASQREIVILREQLKTLQQQVAQERGAASSSSAEGATGVQPGGKELAKSVDDLHERQAMQEAEIAVHEQTKVESESKYPVKLSGLILLSGFSNSSQVDAPATPTFALPGNGSAGVSLRQTILGVDARGPHLFGARSSADLRVDFYGAPQAGAYNNTAGLLRLRTAHAALSWKRTEAFFALDRPLISPDSPSSLTAVAEPALAWSGNLWSWNPEFGARHDVAVSSSMKLRVEGALIDVADPPALASLTTQPVLTAPSTAERSRWPGVEARVALLASKDANGARVGAGGYFSTHRTAGGLTYNAWAGTVDYRFPLPGRFQWSGSAYRGASLGGLGGGAYKDYLFDVRGTGPHAVALDDVGGWSQLKQRFSERLEWNTAYGIDNAFAGQLRPSASATYAPYQNLARNRTLFTNMIYSPSAYLLFSFEFRYVQSSPVNSPTATANIFGVAAAYKF